MWGLRSVGAGAGACSGYEGARRARVRARLRGRSRGAGRGRGESAGGAGASVMMWEIGDDVGERWGLGVRRDIRRVRRWRGHDGREATGAIAGAWRERYEQGLPGGERFESRVGYWGGLRRVGHAG